MNRLALFFSLIFFAFSANAQTDTVEIEDLVFLTDGSFFRGKIIEWKQGEWLKIKTRDGLELQFREKRIRKIRQKRYGGPPEIRNTEYRFRERGIYNSTSLAILPGESDGDTAFDGYGFLFSHTTGFQFSRAIGLGGGVGWASYAPNNSYERLRFVPVFAEVRGYFFRRKLTPYFNFQAGYGFSIDPDFNDGWSESSFGGGPFFSQAIGYRFGGRAANFTLDFGLHFQKSRQLFEWPGGRNDTRYSFNRFCLRTGLVF